MTRKLHISNDLSLPLDAVTETFCIVGIRGSGKSTTAVDIAEEMLKAKQQIVVLDPKDDWHGLRSSADGKSEGFPVTILGGAHQDAPLEAMGVTPCLQVPCADGSVQRLRNPWHWPDPCRLWVRETHYRYGYWRKDGLTKQGRQRWRFIAVHETRIPEQFEKVYYEATSRPPVVLTKRSAKRGWYKRPSIFLPFALARIVDEITDVRIERLQDISIADIQAEGILNDGIVFEPGKLYRIEQLSATRDLWAIGWDEINGKRKGCAWANNPWCWVLSFRRIQPK